MVVSIGRSIGAMLVAVCVVAPASSRAQHDRSGTDFTQMSLKELMSLDVFTSASLLPTQTTRAPGTVYSFKREDFDRFGVRRVEDLLQYVPGFQLNQYRKRHRSIWARGLLDRYNDKLVLLVDGVPVRQLYYGHFSLGDNLPLEQIEKVEIILGPASSLYGANAFGGLISVTTREFSDHPEVEVSLEAGNHQRKKTTASYNSQKFQGFASYLDQDAPYRDDRKSFIGSQVLQPLDEDYTNLRLKARPVDGLTLALDYTENETPFLFIPATQDAYVNSRLLSLSANYKTGNLEDGQLDVTAYHTSDRTREYELEQQTQTLGYSERQYANVSGASAKIIKRLGNHVGAVGASWQQEDARKMDFVRDFHFAEGFLPEPRRGFLLNDPTLTTRNFALFAQDVWSLTGDLNLTLGARYDDFDQFGSYGNYRGALVYTPLDRQTWKLMYGTAIRTPTFREYLKVLESDFTPPVLEPEKLSSLEIGYQYQWNQANISINLFRNVVDDFIFEMPTPDGGDEYFSNLADTWDLEGAESVLMVRPSAQLTLRLAASYLEIRGSRTNDVPYVANWTGSFHGDYQLNDNHQLGLGLFYNSKRPETNAYSDDTPDSFVSASIFANGRLSPQLTYSLGIDNLFNKRIVDPASDFGGQYNTERAGREIWLRMTWSFAP